MTKSLLDHITSVTVHGLFRLNVAPIFSYTTSQGSETSGRNRFLPGRMEETGKKVFLPVSSGKNWKKLEESGRNWKKCTPI